MRTLVLSVLACLALAAGAQAISSGPGGTVYWDALPTTTSSGMLLYKVDLTASWDCAVTGIVQFDCVTFNQNATDKSGFYSIGGTSAGSNINGGYVEIYSHRTNASGAGTVLLEPSIPNPTLTAPDGYSAWVVDTVNPNVHGSAAAITTPDPQTFTVPRFNRAVRVPDGWQSGTVSHGLSMMVFNPYDAKAWYMHDQDGSGVIDCTTTERTQFTMTEHADDVELGGDGNLYYTTDTSKVYRCHMSGSSLVQDLYFTLGGATNPAQTTTGGHGLAVGPGSTPVVYTVGIDCGTNKAIFALRDGDGGGISLTDPLDCVTEIWKPGDWGIKVDSGTGSVLPIEDLEVVVDPGTGKKFLLANSYYYGLFVLELADNGLGTLAGRQIMPNGITGVGAGPGISYSGFEFDANPAPEPATLLLVGTGAMGAFGFLRRRRMK